MLYISFTRLHWFHFSTCRSSGSGCIRDLATFYQMRIFINRRNVVNDPTKNVAACEEFFLLVVEAHILSAAMQVFDMSTLDSIPSNTELFPKEATDLNSVQRRNVCLVAVRSFRTNLLTYRSLWLHQASPALQFSTTMCKSMPEKSLTWAYYWWSSLTWFEKEMGWESSVVGGCSSQFLTFLSVGLFVIWPKAQSLFKLFCQLDRKKLQAWMNTQLHNL